MKEMSAFSTEFGEIWPSDAFLCLCLLASLHCVKMSLGPPLFSKMGPLLFATISRIWVENMGRIWQ